MRLLSVLSLAGAAPALRQPALGQKPSDDPIAPVIELLEKIQQENLLETREDEAHWKKWSCYFKENEKSLAEAIAHNTQQVEDATINIEKMQAKIQQHTTEARTAEVELKEATENLEKKSKEEDVRQEEYTLRAKELTQAGFALNAAIKTLQKHQQNAFMQVGAAQMKKVAKTLSDSIVMYQKPISPLAMKKVQGFLQQPTFSEYQNQSGEIFGLLTTMQEQFEQDLAKAHEDDAKSREAMAALAEATAQKQEQKGKRILFLNGELQRLSSDVARDQVTKTQNEELLRANTKARDELIAENDRKSAAYTERKANRSEEDAAVKMALGILKDDRAREARQNHFGAGFLQIASKKKTSSRAFKTKSRKSLILAQTKVKTEGAFKKITDEIDTRILGIEEEIKNNQVTHDDCVANLAKYQDDITKETRVLENLQNQLESETLKKQELERQLKENNEESAANIDRMKKLGTERLEEFDSYKAAIKEAQYTVHVLENAIDALKVYMPKSTKAELIQRQPEEGAAQKDEQNASGMVVIQLINKIKGEVETNVNLMNTDEQASQKAYEGETMNLNQLNVHMHEVMLTLEADIADKQMLIVGVEGDIEFTQDKLKQLTAAHKAMQANCEFVMTHLGDLRSHAQTEISALKSAKQFLQTSGDAIVHSQKQLQRPQSE